MPALRSLLGLCVSLLNHHWTDRSSRSYAGSAQLAILLLIADLCGLNVHLDIISIGTEEGLPDGRGLIVLQRLFLLAFPDVGKLTATSIASHVIHSMFVSCDFLQTLLDILEFFGVSRSSDELTGNKARLLLAILD